MTEVTRRRLLKLTGATLAELNPASMVLCGSVAMAGPANTQENTGPVILPAVAGMTAAGVGRVIYPVTAAERALGVTPANFGYPADPYVDPRRYGGDPTGAVVSTSAVQTAINVAYRSKGTVWLGNDCNYLCGALSLTMTGNHSTDGLRIAGSAVNGSKITCSGPAAALLTFIGSTPTGTPQESPITLENFTLHLSGQTTDGLVFNGCAGWIVRNLCIQGGNRNIFVNSGLCGVIESSVIYSGNYGVYCRTNGSGAPPNLVRIRDCAIAANRVYGIDYDTGSELQVISCDLEQNGDPNNENVHSGAIHIGGTINAAPKFGLGKVVIRDCWIEASRGAGWAVQVDAPTAGQFTDISIQGGHIVATANRQPLRVSGASNLLIENCFSPTPGDTWNLTATRAALRNCGPATLVDTGITHPTYTNVTFSTGTFINGRTDSVVGTLTGCTTSATGAIAVHQQGDAIELRFASLTAVSDTDACTITGLPSKYWPAADCLDTVIVADNGIGLSLPCLVSAATGVITLGFGHTFATSGQKGCLGGSIRYRRP